MVSPVRYSYVAMLLHWAIAALILFNLFLGWRMGFLKGLAQFTTFQLHKSVGVTVLLLTVLRVAWRLGHKAPELPAGMPMWEQTIARVTHWLFYGLMIAMPLSGWAMVSMSPLNIPTLLWGAIPWPSLQFLHNLPTPQKHTADAVSHAIHLYLAWAGAALIGLHVAAALRHQFLIRDGVLGRMLPGSQAKSISH